MAGMRRLHTVRFRQSNGVVEVMHPKGSTLLRVHQSGSGYWFADLLAPVTTELEPLRLWLVSHRDTQTDIDPAWECVGHATSHQGHRTYVFHKPKAPAKRKPGRPRKTAPVPPTHDGPTE